MTSGTPKASKHPSVGLLVAAAVVFVAGLFLGSQGLTCGSQPMSPGDRCFQDGEPRSYEEMKRAHEQLPLRFGVIALGIAIVAVVVGLRRRPADPSAQGEWEANFAREKALAIETYMAGVPPEQRAARRLGIEAEFVRVESEQRKKLGFPPAPH